MSKTTRAALLAAAIPLLGALGTVIGAGAKLMEAEAELRRERAQAQRAEREAAAAVAQQDELFQSFQEYVEFVMKERGCEP